MSTGRRKKKPAADAASSASPESYQLGETHSAAAAAIQEFQFAPTPKQWRYFEELEAQADTGQVLTLKETAKRLQIAAETISIWHRDPRFVRVEARIIRSHNDPLFELAVRVVTRRAIQTGSPKHLETVARIRGLWDLVPELPAGSTGSAAPGAPAGAVASASVTFVGLPVPPTAAQAAALNPPPGSTLIVPAPALPPVPSRASGGGP